MLTATVEQEGRTRLEHMFVIDCHSHLGQDVDGAAMMNPLAPGTGTFDFWGNVQGKIKADWDKTGEQSFTTNIHGKSVKISWAFNPFPFTEKLYAALEAIKGRYSDLREKSKFYSFIDQSVVFPFQDVFRDKHPEALYRASNINVSRFTTRFPFSMKLIGYARCNPMEGERAVNEVKYAREVLGLRGLKQHPRSEGWVDTINSEQAVNVLIEAAKHSMPVIFDTRGKGSIMAIGELIKSTRAKLKSGHSNLLPHFKVIIAHFAQGNIGDNDVYNTIVQPNTYGDLSMLHGEGAANFLESFRKWFISNRKETIDNRTWSQYLIYGSDYPYFGDAHAEKLIIYIINKRFFDTGGTLEDSRNILGLNLLSLLPEYNLAAGNKETRIAPSIIVSTSASPQPETKAQQLAIFGLAKLISDNKIDVKKFVMQFSQEWERIKEDLLLSVVSTNTNQETNLAFLNLIKDKVMILAPLAPNIPWKKFSFKYFNPEDRAVFASFFKSCYLANDESKVVELLTHIVA